jgi:hypothetical protein
MKIEKENPPEGERLDYRGFQVTCDDGKDLVRFVVFRDGRTYYDFSWGDDDAQTPDLADLLELIRITTAEALKVRWKE